MLYNLFSVPTLSPTPPTLTQGAQKSATWHAKKTSS